MKYTRDVFGEISVSILFDGEFFVVNSATERKVTRRFFQRSSSRREEGTERYRDLADRSFEKSRSFFLSFSRVVTGNYGSISVAD